jgi:hypothetical protein
MGIGGESYRAANDEEDDGPRCHDFFAAAVVTMTVMTMANSLERLSIVSNVPQDPVARADLFS